MKKSWLLVLALAAAPLRAEEVPLRDGGVVTGELDRVAAGQLVIRVPGGVRSYAMSELARAWKDVHWQRLGLPPPPRRGGGIDDTWRGIFRAESVREAAAFMQADPVSAWLGAAVLTLLGTNLCLRGRILARAGGLPVFVLAMAVLGLSVLLLTRAERGWGFLCRTWGADERLRLAAWVLLNFFALALCSSVGDERRRGWLELFARRTPERRRMDATFGVALFGGCLLAQAAFVALLARGGFFTADLQRTLVIAVVAGAACTLIGCLLQLPYLRDVKT